MSRCEARIIAVSEGSLAIQGRLKSQGFCILCETDEAGHTTMDCGGAYTAYGVLLQCFYRSLNSELRAEHRTLTSIRSQSRIAYCINKLGRSMTGLLSGSTATLSKTP